ncbi:alpha/beta hydrolase family protein [Phytoactinopolyspora mesophila]|uniref:Prolyl oligopeptidase family serine peptidase n=1 Tax=Phytoactinopolyspora mesophila TaxID=2650750 RepID=A0A7K3M3E6_9ACTN|nr:prolyl oligopeptidase family serine peptidase [Phytoactinopolyspora mesophila]NDL57829.1 prolyl oligopeptidase family serine peptidase [Phytoactinopolyspora mesophila]
MPNTAHHITGHAAGVPFVAFPPATAERSSAPVIVAWHMMDAPRTEAAFAAAMPLEGLDAWRIYLGLPMSGSRLPDGGFEEIMRLGFEDAVLNLQGPIVDQAAQEFSPVMAELRDRLGLSDGPLGVLGGSLGAAVALVVLAESSAKIDAAVLVSPLVQLRPAVEAMARQFGITYPWSPESSEVAERLDFVARAGDVVRPHQPAVLLVVGEDDDADAFAKPASALREALDGHGDVPGRTDLVTIAGMGHALAEEPGMEPAEQTPHAREVDRHAVEWLRRHLIGA